MTSCLFDEQGSFQEKNIHALCDSIGKNRIVIDLSCKKIDNQWVVMRNKWKNKTNLVINKESLLLLSEVCDEILVHAIDVE